MAKRRKTRKEKLRAQARRQENSRKPQELTAATTETVQERITYNAPAINKQIPGIVQKDYSFVQKDIRHTLIITSILLGLNLLLYFLIQRGIINLSALGV